MLKRKGIKRRVGRKGRDIRKRKIKRRSKATRREREEEVHCCVVSQAWSQG